MGDVVGVIHLKDIFTVIDEQGPIDLTVISRPPRIVPETMPMSKLLSHFQSHRQHMAFIVDELGTITGIITLEDVLEEIVGKIEDEFDQEQPDIVADDKGNYIVKGTMTLSTLIRMFRNLKINIFCIHFNFK